MTDFVEKLKKHIRRARNIRDSSLRVYIFNIVKLHHKMFDNREVESLDFLKNRKRVMELIDGLKLSSPRDVLGFRNLPLEISWPREHACYLP